MSNDKGMFAPIQKNDSIKQGKDEGIAIPIPDNAGSPGAHPTLGMPKKWWAYKTADGQALLIVSRFEKEDGSKEDRPLTFRRYLNGGARWAWKSIPEPRILYNLDKLSTLSDKPILVCEGEKAAEAAEILFPEYVVTTSTNGARSPHKTDWSPVKGREVMIWPDNDQSGFAYADSVAQLCLKSGAVSVHAVQVPADFKEGWDLADPLPKGINSENLKVLMSEARQIFSAYEEATHAAYSLSPDSQPHEIEKALKLIVSLSEIEQERIKKIISKNAKIPLGVQNKALKNFRQIVADDDDAGMDHLDLARSLIDEVGRDNILSTAAHLWVWRNKGLWEALPDLDIKKTIQGHLNEMGQKVTRGLVDSVLSVLKNEVFAEQHQWDLNPDIINVQNGDLVFSDQRWILQPHKRENFRTTQIPHPYIHNAECPRFLKFLDEIFSSDMDGFLKKQLLLELIGYTLTNTTKFEKFVILIGSGSNGKSVLLEVIAALVGLRNVSAVQPAEFSDKFKRAHMHRKLANLVTEVAQGGTIADAEVKAITSGELITADHKNQPPFDFKPYCTCWFGTNHMPRTKDFSDALYRRAIVVTFNRKFEGNNVDVDLKKTLLTELPGIMRASLDAYAGVLKRGSFTEPPSSIQAKETWRKEEDHVSQFVDECCDFSPNAKEASKELYAAYRNWAEEQGVRHIQDHNSFTSRLLTKGLKKDRMSKGVRAISGLRLRERRE